MCCRFSLRELSFVLSFQIKRMVVSVVVLVYENCHLCSSFRLRELSFVLSVVDWDRILPNESIGQTTIGYKASGTSLKHWTDTMDHPRKTIAMWHKIIT